MWTIHTAPAMNMIDRGVRRSMDDEGAQVPSTPERDELLSEGPAQQWTSGGRALT